MFENSLKIIEECDLTYLHVFPYSEREGTPAAKIPNQVPGHVRKERAKILRKAGQNQLHNLLINNINKVHQVLVEKENFGHTENFIPVRVGDDVKSGEIVTFKAKSVQGDQLVGKVV